MVIKSADRLTGLVPHGLTHILCFEKKKKTEKKTKEKTVCFLARAPFIYRSLQKVINN